MYIERILLQFTGKYFYTPTAFRELNFVWSFRFFFYKTLQLKSNVISVSYSILSFVDRYLLTPTYFINPILTLDYI